MEDRKGETGRGHCLQDKIRCLQAESVKHQEEFPGCEVQTEMGVVQGEVRVFPGAKGEGWEGQSQATVIWGQCIILVPGRQTTLTSWSSSGCSWASPEGQDRDLPSTGLLLSPPRGLLPQFWQSLKVSPGMYYLHCCVQLPQFLGCPGE